MIIPFFSVNSTGSSSGTSVLIFLLILTFIVARRLYRNYTGVKVSAARTIGYTAFYFLFGAFFLIASFVEGVPSYYAIPEAVVLLMAAVGSYRLADRRLSFWRSPSNGDVIFYKGGIIIYLIYIIGLIARLAIEFIYIGPSAFTFAVASLSQTAIIATAVTDLLLTFGIGLLVGRNVRVYQRFRAIMEGKESIATFA